MRKHISHSATLGEKLELYSVRSASSGCIIWNGYLDKDGYGKLGFKYKSFYAHRAAWQVCHGPIPDGVLVLHSCDVPSCINPDHLFLGSHQDNVDDKVAKQRQTMGTDCHSSKLTEP